MTATDRQNVSFKVPSDLPRETQYNFQFSVFRASEPDTDNYDETGFRITVNNLDPVECNDPPGFVYEESPPFAFDCTDKGTLSGVTWEWGPPSLLTHLMHTDGVTPTFTPPELPTPYEKFTYTVTARVNGADIGGSEVTVQVLATPQIRVECDNPFYNPYEGADDFVLDCSASGGHGGPDYDYVWTGRGSTTNTDKLSDPSRRNPTFYVPDNVDADQTYEYTLTVSAENAVDGIFNVTVKVLNKSDIIVTCPGNPYSKYEGEDDFDLDCSATGAPEDSEYDYVWTGRGSTTNTNKLIAGTDGPTPTFDVPGEVDSDETYEYTLTVSAEGAKDDVANVTVTVKNKPSITVTCPGDPYSAYEGEGNIVLDCEATGKPSDSEYVYAWTPRGSTPNTDKLSGTTIAQPTFEVPGSVDSDETYEYTLTVSAENAEDGEANVTVTVKNKPSITVTCPGDPYSAYEGEGNIVLDCEATGKPSDSEYVYAWTPRGSTPNTDNLIAGTDGPTPTFDVPDNIDADTDYEYTLTVSARGADSETANVMVRVLNKPSLTLVCTPVAPVYEGSPDFDLNCSASGAPEGSDPVYEWKPRGSTTNTAQLSSTTVEKPTFYVPSNVNADTDYEYTLTVSARGADPETANVTVRVLNKPSLTLICTPPAPVYEGAADFDLDCVASGAPSGSEYDYVWTGRGSTVVPGRLSGTTIVKPTFDVPEEVSEDETYEYTLTVSAENAIDAEAAVTVKVLNLGSIALICASPPLVYEGSEDFALDCSILGNTGDADYTYEWTARGATANTDLLSATDSPTPTFAVPDQLEATTTYEYLLTARTENVEDATAEVTVTVLNRGTLAVACAPPPLVYEGAADFALDCTVSGAPVGSEYVYVWTGRGSTVNTDLLTSGTDGPTPTFAVPDALDATTTYEYLLTVSAENAESASAAVTVTVLNHGALSVVCVDPPSVYEGSEDFALDCSASGAPSGSEYDYVWTARDSTANTDQLSATDISSPTFYVPDEVDEDETYEYLLTASADNAEDGTVEVTVTVLNREMLSVTCKDTEVYEGEGDIMLDCSASGAPSGSGYTYVWTARGGTANTDLLIAGTDGPAPTFSVPAEVDENGETYEYLLTVSADNAEDASAEMTVNVLDNLPLAFVDDSIAGRVYVFTVGEVIADILLPEATGGLFPYTHILTPLLPRGLSLKKGIIYKSCQRAS